MSDSVAHSGQRIFIAYPPRADICAQHFLSFPTKKHSAFLPGELPAGSLLARLLPFSHAWIGCKQSSCSIKREAVTNHGKRICLAEEEASRVNVQVLFQSETPGERNQTYSESPACQQCAFPLSGYVSNLRQKPDTFFYLLSLSRSTDSFLVFKLVQLRAAPEWAVLFTVMELILYARYYGCESCNEAEKTNVLCSKI